MAAKTKTKTARTAKRPKSSAKATRKLLAPKVKSKIGLKRLREAVRAVQEAAAA
jgi:hypothetical protein